MRRYQEPKIKTLLLSAFLLACIIPLGFCDDATFEKTAIPPASCFDPAYVSTHPWYDVTKPTAERVRLLVAQLNDKEKCGIIGWFAKAVPRLGIPAYDAGNEGLHGLVRPWNNTSYPHGIAMGAMFDPDLVHQMSSAISDEARARWNATGGQVQFEAGTLILWSPVVNMARDPRWGRTQETYGEDPFLSSRLGVAFVKGLQGDDPTYIKVVATPKHFAGNNQEYGRSGKNISCDERYLCEYELFPFHACVSEAHAQSIMAAYTSINGTPSCENKWLLTDLLRTSWGFDGFVTSDCGAISHIIDSFHLTKTPEEAVANALNAGLDFEGGGFSKYPDMVNQQLPAAVAQGLVSQEVLDRAVTRVLTVRMRLGMFDPPQDVPFHTIPESVICCPEHQALARKMADEEIVLLKNQAVDGKPALPLDLHTVKRLALVGPNADILNLGDYSGSPLRQQCYTALQGLKERCDQAGIALDYYPWVSGADSVVPADRLHTESADGKGTVQGLTGSYYSTAVIDPKKDKPTATRVDSSLNFDWSHAQPDPLAQGKEFSVEWTGTIHCDVPGRYTFAITCDGGAKLTVNRTLGFDNLNNKGAKRQTHVCTVAVGQPGDVPLSITYRHAGGDTGLVLKWTPPQQQDPYFADLKKDDAVIAIMGLTYRDESEGFDRTTLHLPAAQEDFIHRLAGVNRRTIVVTESGSSLAVPSVANQVPALLQMFYGGQEQGRALADVLFGDYNPAGRLPLTFYADDSQLRPMTEYDLTKGRTYLYLQDKPTYAFGYGLSYTKFTYANLKLSTASAKVGEPFTASVDVSNTGDRDGDEVVQGYVTAQKASVPMPIRQLWAFQRVHIPHGQTKTVTLSFDSSNFGHWDKARQNFVVEPGTFKIQVGAASDDIRATAPIQLTR